MKRPLRPEEARLWAVVAATVRPTPGREASTAKLGAAQADTPVTAPPHATSPTPPKHAAPYAAKAPSTRPPPSTPEDIEPNRRRRISRGRDAIAARLDLHGYDQDRARARVGDFLPAPQADGARAVLVITGKGFSGEGVLRRRTPEWLADPRLREVVAGLSPAEDRHGGAGAFYVALKRKPR